MRMPSSSKVHDCGKSISGVKAKPPNEVTQSNFICYCRPLQIFSFVNGAYPLTVRNNKFEISIFNMCVCLTYSLTVAILRLWLEEKNANTGFFYTVLHIKNLLLPIACILSYIFMIFKIKKLTNILNNAVTFCHFMKQDDMKKFLCMQILMIFLTYFFSIALVVIYYVVAPSAFDGVELYNRLLDAQMYVTIWSLKLHFVFIIFYYKYILSCLRRELKAILLIETPFSVNIISTNLKLQFSMWEKVMKQSELLNECFGVTIGVGTLLTVLNCISTAYFHVTLGEFQNGLGYLLILWMLYDFSEQWTVLTSVELFMTQASRMAIDVHETMRLVKDNTLRRQLKEFSLYLVHRSVKFTICGLVPLNYSLLYQIAGTVTTYMVVLVQFQKTVEPQIKHFVNCTY